VQHSEMHASSPESTCIAESYSTSRAKLQNQKITCEIRETTFSPERPERWHRDGFDLRPSPALLGLLLPLRRGPRAGRLGVGVAFARMPAPAGTVGGKAATCRAEPVAGMGRTLMCGPCDIRASESGRAAHASAVGFGFAFAVAVAGETGFAVGGARPVCLCF